MKLWKRWLAALLALLLGVSLLGCGDAKSDAVDSAVEALKEAWTAYYQDCPVDTDGYLQIVNTRVVTLKENHVPDMRNVAYIVEFVLYADYYGAAPYYVAATGVMDTVTVYKDGTVSVGSNPLKAYSSKTYSWDYSSFVESTEDLGDAHNVTWDLKED